MSLNNQTSRVDSVEFALALHRRFAKAKVSVLLSPVSISLALRPLRLGARGDTAAALREEGDDITAVHARRRDADPGGHDALHDVSTLRARQGRPHARAGISEWVRILRPSSGLGLRSRTARGSTDSNSPEPVDRLA